MLSCNLKSMRWKTFLVSCLLLGFTLAAKSQPFSSPAWIAIGVTNVTNVCIVSWVAGPPTMNGAVVAGGGSGTVTISNYTGQAIALSAVGLEDPDQMVLECSTNLTDWHGFPTDGFQLTFLPTNSATVIIPPPDTPILFFRGRLMSQPTPMAFLLESPVDRTMYSSKVLVPFVICQAF